MAMKKKPSAAVKAKLAAEALAVGEAQKTFRDLASGMSQLGANQLGTHQALLRIEADIAGLRAFINQRLSTPRGGLGLGVTPGPAY